MASPMGIPDDFTLVIGNDHIQHACHVAWRKDKRIGVAFTDLEVTAMIAQTGH